MHAEGYPAGEMKHGPIALIEPSMSVLAINSNGTSPRRCARTSSKCARAAARDRVGSRIRNRASADERVEVPDAAEWLVADPERDPAATARVPQAVLKGTDIDKPRNLAKSVTVE